MNIQKKLIIVIMVLITTVGIATFVYKKFVQPVDKPENGVKSGEIKGDEKADLNPAGDKTFTHPGYGFSFNYPNGWNASSFSEGEGETVLIQKSQIQMPNDKSNPNVQTGIQIFISLFDEPENSLTKERILQDIPDLKIANDKNIKVSDLDALSFESVNEAGQATKEIWFVYNGFLYQISAIEGSGEILGKMIGTWKFN